MIRDIPGQTLRSFGTRLRQWKAEEKYWWSIVWGGVVHSMTGKTPVASHQSLYALFSLAGGAPVDRMAGFVAALSPPSKLPPAVGVLGDLTGDRLNTIRDHLDQDGYYVFENCLSAEFCERILQRSLELDCFLLGDDHSPAQRRGRFNRSAPEAPKYLASEDDTTDIPEVQELLSDPSLIAVAQAYLRAKPIFSGISLWWSPSVKASPDDEAAQRFHWDMERIRWIRFFVYLTDVGEENGPHCFIRGSHRTGAIPPGFLAKGYARIPDDEIVGHYGVENYRAFTGKRGTIIAEDSRGFHKGDHPRQGDRLMLAFELSTTLFGANKRHVIRNIHVPRFGEFSKKYPHLYSNFDFAKG